MTDIAETPTPSRDDPAVSVSVRAAALRRAGPVFVATPAVVVALVAFVAPRRDPLPAGTPPEDTGP